MVYRAAKRSYLADDDGPDFFIVDVPVMVDQKIPEANYFCLFFNLSANRRKVATQQNHCFADQDEVTLYRKAQVLIRQVILKSFILCAAENVRYSPLNLKQIKPGLISINSLARTLNDI